MSMHTMPNCDQSVSIYLWIFNFLILQTISHTVEPQQALIPSPPLGTHGCRLLPITNPGQTRNFTLYSKHGGGQRQYLLHLPSKYQADHPHPLILCFHGFTDNMYHQELVSEFSNSTVNPDAIAVYPQGLGSPPAWQGAPYSREDVNDLAFINDLITHLEAHYCIDESRIFATGMSNGGGFVNTLACSTEGKGFAAFAAVAGAFYGDVAGEDFECKPAQLPVPILEIHGDEDGIISYLGGKASGVSIPAIPDWLHRWAGKNGCSDSSSGKVRNLVHGHVQETTYSCNGSHEIVTGLKVEGMVHIWPSTTPSYENDNVATWINAAPYILNFFEKHRKKPGSYNRNKELCRT